MTQDQKLNYLSLALRIIGAVFVVGIYPLMMWIWPSGWGWEPRQPEYEWMIIGIYATLGVFLVLAAKNPLEHLSLIRFTICSSLVHGGIMLVQGIADENERANLVGDVPALFLVAVVLWVLVPRQHEP
ncbi:MAG: DUF6632 domain-containing protein [Methylomicrobium sp.]